MMQPWWSLPVQNSCAFEWSCLVALFEVSIITDKIDSGMHKQIAGDKLMNCFVRAEYWDAHDLRCLQPHLKGFIPTIYNIDWIWVNYNISLTWILRPFGDDFPIKTMIPGFGRDVRSWLFFYPDWMRWVDLKILHRSHPTAAPLTRLFWFTQPGFVAETCWAGLLDLDPGKSCDPPKNVLIWEWTYCPFKS